MRNEFRTRAVIDAASSRTYHVGAVLGPGLLVHGGQGMESLATLGDWNLYDFGLAIWIKIDCFEQSDDPAVASPAAIKRKNHSLTTFIATNIQGGKELTRKMWCCTL